MDFVFFLVSISVLFVVCFICCIGIFLSIYLFSENISHSQGNTMDKPNKEG